jgi:hypothetical protein
LFFFQEELQHLIFYSIDFEEIFGKYFSHER